MKNTVDVVEAHCYLSISGELIVSRHVAESIRILFTGYDNWQAVAMAMRKFPFLEVTDSVNLVLIGQAFVDLD